MTESDAAPDRGQRTRLLAGIISCLVGLLLGAAQLFFAFPSGDANTSAGILGIAFCILGCYLGSRKLATATVFLCVAAILISLSALQHFS
jgi:membrane-associated phospholipid phosphatase